MDLKMNKNVKNLKINKDEKELLKKSILAVRIYKAMEKECVTEDEKFEFLAKCVLMDSKDLENRLKSYEKKSNQLYNDELKKNKEKEE